MTTSSIGNIQPLPEVAPEHSQSKNGKVFAILGIISGCIAFALFPPFFGILGIILGIVAMKKQQKQLGWVAVGVSIAGLVVGMVLGALFYVNVQSGDSVNANNASVILE